MSPVEDIAWIASFAVLLVVLNYVNGHIWRCLNEKPLVTQSTFDSTVKDAIILIRIYGSVSCVVAIVGRIQPVQDIFLSNEHYLMLPGTNIIKRFCCI